ncbi:DUF423 domain-containing protein [Emticicia sp. CRIBPO]|uniref:DUF423 domain-containing protein n=1 Tax=Emticicia sp. CRIBPO TaxID=2683258 RepID=UPI001411B68E|nr:DUF423 domain-containing protein [Emticicia sp. CRIBPO]NBA88847.1 DUF423 domain-containing protein [Emticicia sp. CRIBPO]
MNKLFLLSGAVLGFLGVGLGAFGAHALKSMLEASNRLETYETAVKYQFYHALFLILIGLLSKDFTASTLKYSGYTTLAGVIIFSGSLYIICFTGIKAFGAVAPIGGTLLLAGWALLFITIFKS